MVKVIRLVIEDGTASATDYYEPLLFEELERLLRREGLRLVRLETVEEAPSDPKRLSKAL